MIVAESPKGETLRIELHEVLARPHVRARRRPRPREGRRRGRAAAADRGPGRRRCARTSPSCAASTRPTSARSTCCAATATGARGGRRDQAGRRDRGRRAAAPLPGAPRPRHPARADARACSSRPASSPRPGSSPTSRGIDCVEVDARRPARARRPATSSCSERSLSTRCSSEPGGTELAHARDEVEAVVDSLLRRPPPDRRG